MMKGVMDKQACVWVHDFICVRIYKGVDEWGLRGLKPPRFFDKIQCGRDKKKRDQVLLEF